MCKEEHLLWSAVCSAEIQGSSTSVVHGVGVGVTRLLSDVVLKISSAQQKTGPRGEKLDSSLSQIHPLIKAECWGKCLLQGAIYIHI